MCACVCMCVYVCVCEKELERERENVYVSVCVCESVCGRERGCACACVLVRMHVCVRVCVWEYVGEIKKRGGRHILCERESNKESQRQKESIRTTCASFAWRENGKVFRMPVCFV